MGAIVRTSTGTTSNTKCHIPGQRVGGAIGSERQEVQLKADTSHQICCFLVRDAIAKEECKVRWILRNHIYADYLTKAQQGAEFCVMRDFIMGVNPFEE